MRRWTLLVIALLALGACATQTRSQEASGMRAAEAPPAGSTILVMAPEIQLSLLTATGLPEPRADWSQAAEANIAAAFAANLQGQGHQPRALDPAAAMSGRSGQLIRLHDAVAVSVLLFQYGPYTLPTHARRGDFSWTLGQGVRELQTAHGARYALFIGGGGGYSSGGRVAATIMLSLLFGQVGTTGGGQQIYCSLVDLETGRIVWFNVAQAGANVDMRTPEGARALVDRVLQDSPL